MKNIINTILFILLAGFMFTSCDPQDSHDLGLGAKPTPEELDFTITPSAESPNIMILKNTSTRVGNAVWDLGNDVTGKGDEIKGIYPYEGEYTITFTLYTTGGALSMTKSISIAKDDLSLLDTPVYRNLTGGADNPDGKIWVFDRYNNFLDEVIDGTKKDIRGHMGLGPLGSYTQEWWGAAPNDKAAWTLYDHKFTFKQNGLALNIQNKGQSYGRAATASKGGYPNTVVMGDDAVYDFAGGDFTFSIAEGGEYPVMTLSGNANLGYYCGSQDYYIFYQTDKVMALRVANTIEGQDWVFIYCLEELNVEPSKPEVPVKPASLSEDFESNKPTVIFVGEEMGDNFSMFYNNPAPVPINQSKGVCLYEKSTGFYSNISHTVSRYKFDLTTNNKIRMKVFIPGYNDYVTEHETAGEWITINKLLPQVAVKLQDSSKGGDAWQTQVEIVKADLVKDKWLELEFDFSSAKDRVDFDKIVIQFGAEGHAAPGIFFFDDFTFSE